LFRSDALIIFGKGRPVKLEAGRGLSQAARQVVLRHQRSGAGAAWMRNGCGTDAGRMTHGHGAHRRVLQLGLWHGVLPPSVPPLVTVALAACAPVSCSGGTKMPVEGISHITLVVRDLERTAQLLKDVLDAREVYSSGDETFSIAREKFFLIGGVWVAIMEGPALSERTYNHVAFKIPEEEFELYKA